MIDEGTNLSLEDHYCMVQGFPCVNNIVIPSAFVNEFSKNIQFVSKTTKKIVNNTEWILDSLHTSPVLWVATFRKALLDTFKAQKLLGG